MNPDLVATFTTAAADIMQSMGGLAELRRGNTVIGVDIRVVLDESVDPIGDFGQRLEPVFTITLTRAAGALVGDLVTFSGISWTLSQLISDDGFIMKFQARK